MRIGIVGGTFNPVHIGHLILAEEAFVRLKLDKVMLVPSYRPPHKDNKDIISSEDRCKMVELAIKCNQHLAVSKLEINRRGKSYSVQTIKEFRKRFGQKVKLFFITGSDSLPELFTWKRINEIFELVSFVVAERPGFPLKEVPPSCLILPITSLQLSSSLIRQRIKEGKSIRYLVPEAVRKYILKKGLYKCDN